MGLLARLAPHLPYVRRYARALTGDQVTGDGYVRVALEARTAGAAGADAASRLMRIAPTSRQAFLLTALEGFTPSEAAQILGVDFEEVERQTTWNT